MGGREGVHGGGWDYRWAVIDWVGGSVVGQSGHRERWEGGPLRQESPSTKGTSRKVNGQRPRTLRWTIMTLC